MPSQSRSHRAELLRADEEQLDRAAIKLRSGNGFVIALCPPKLWPAALGRLRDKIPGLTLPDPVEVGDAWQMLDALVEQVKRDDRILSMTLGGDRMSALDGLNLHREKVLKGGPVILWLPDADELMKMRERAPDAFSFRSTMVVVRGDGGVMPAPKGEEPEAITRARARLRRARTPIDRAAESAELAHHLVRVGGHAEAEQVLRAALPELSDAASEDEDEVRARLCTEIFEIAVARGRIGEALAAAKDALEVIDRVPMGRGLPLRVEVLSSFPGATDGVDRARVEEAERILLAYGLAPEAAVSTYSSYVRVAADLGDLRQARRRCDRLRAAADRDIAAQTLLWWARASIADTAGDFLESERAYREAGNLHPAAEPPLLLSMNFIHRGELAAAERLLEKAAHRRASFVSGLRAGLLLARGCVAEAQAYYRASVQDALSAGSDQDMFSACTVTAQSALLCEDAERMSADIFGQVLADLQLGIDLLPPAPGVPPWYPIQLLSLRAALLSLTPDTLPQALDLSRQALDLAHKTYPDLSPETARALADHLLTAKQPDEALSTIATVEPYATANGFLKERARLLADRVLALVLRNDPADAITPHMTALREACAATDSPRITAETLRDLAKRLPPTCTTPDPHVLAEEAHALFLAMPMPAEDARCLEIMGDVDLALGRPDEARRRYQAARARLERYGLGLRVPLLTRKLEALP